jgi:hypothetical protein
VTPFHICRGRHSGGEPESFVQWLRIAREQRDPAKPLKIRMGEDLLDHPRPIPRRRAVAGDDDVG